MGGCAVDYMTSAEAAKNWGVSVRAVSYHLSAGRIPGARKKGKLWLIPSGAKRPADQRRKEGAPPAPSLSSQLGDIITATAASLPAKNPDSLLDKIQDPQACRQYAAELAYFRGDFKGVLAGFRETEGNALARLRICFVAIAAAVSTGDYAAYTQMQDFLQGCIQAEQGSKAAAFAELSLATVALSCIVPNMTPDWLRRGDFSLIYPAFRPFALYLRAKYYQCTGQPALMLAVAQTALTLSAPEEGFTLTDIYLQLSCAAACHALEQEEEARKYLLSAMNTALPNGFITPFAENITALGGLVETCLEREFPESRDAVLKQWEHTFQNWTTFHNHFTKEHLTMVLTRREYHIAQMAARRIPYAKIAGQQGISVGRVKNIMMVVYEKLFISGREELARYVF
jgi:DNA-binding CsgD family transcriptional regulator